MILSGTGVMITSFFPSYVSMYIFDLVILVIAFVLNRLVNPEFIGKAD